MKLKEPPPYEAPGTTDEHRAAATAKAAEPEAPTLAEKLKAKSEDGVDKFWSESQQKHVPLAEFTEADHDAINKLHDEHYLKVMAAFGDDSGEGQPPESMGDTSVYGEAPGEAIFAPKHPTDVEKTLSFKGKVWSESGQAWESLDDLNSSDREYLRKISEPKVGEASKETTSWWHGSNHPEPSLTPGGPGTNGSIKAVWVASHPAVSEAFAYGSRATISRVYIRPGKYFDFRDPEHKAEFDKWVDDNVKETGMTGSKGVTDAEGLKKEMETAHYTTLQRPEVQRFLKEKGYEGYMEREFRGTPVNLAVFDKDKILRGEGATKVRQQLVRLRQHEAPESARDTEGNLDQSKAGEITSAYVEGERPDPATTAGLHAVEAAHPAGGGSGPPKGPGDLVPSTGAPGQPPRLKPNAGILTDRFWKNVGEQPGAPRVGIISNLRRALSSFSMLLTPADEIDKRLALGKDQMGVADWLRMTLRANSMADASWNREGSQWDPTARGGEGQMVPVKTPLAKDVMAKIKANRGSTQEWWAYRGYARTIEMAKRGLDSGFDLQDAMDFMSIPEMHEKYGEPTEMMRRMKDNDVDFLVNTGVLNKERGQSMKDLGEFHMSLHRIMDPKAFPQIDGTGKILGTPRQLRNLKGGMQQITNPAISEAANHNFIWTMGLRNLARANIVRIFKDPIPANRRIATELGMEDVTDEVLGRDTETGEALRGELLDDKGKVIPKEVAEATTPFMQEQRVRGKMRDGEFSYYDNGELRVFRVNDPDFIRMLDITAISHRFNPIADAMRAITRVGLAGVGGLMNPGFVFRAATHGQIAALITSPRWAVPYWDMATKAAPEMFRGMMGKATPALDEAIRQGAVEARNSMDKDFIESGVYDQDLRSYWEKTGYGKMMWNALKSPFDLYNHFGHAVHRMANLGYFMRHNDGAVNPLKLGMETQQVYLDRAEPFMGSFVNWWAERTMFMSIGFKESAQFAKAMQARPFTTMAMGMGAMFLPQMAVTMANLLQDEFLPEGERYMDFTQEQRDHMTILPRMPGGWRPQLPKPYYLNAIFQAPAERFVLGMMGKSPNSWKQDFREILTLMLPPMVANALLPGIEQATNRNLTTGQPIITDRQSPMSADRRFGPNTTVVAKKLTDILGDPAGGGGLGIPKQIINPRALDNFMDRWLSNVGVQVVAAVGGRMDPRVHAYDVGGPNGWTHYPILSTFFTTAKDGGIPRDLLDNLWDEVQKFQTAKADASSYKQEAHQEGTDNETPDTIRGMSKFKIQRYTKQLAGFQNAISGIEHNDEMTDVEKHKEMAGIMPDIIAQAEAMKKALDEAEAGYKARTSGQ